MLEVEKTSLSRLVEDGLETLMFAHWTECSIHREAVPLDPDWSTAATMERCGILQCFGLFDDGELAGYAIFEVSPHLNFKTTKYAFNTGIYVRPESRKGTAAFKLLSESEKRLKDDGVKKIVFSVPQASALNAVLPKGGYEPSELYYTKLVD